MRVQTTVELTDRERLFVGYLADGIAPSPAAVKAGFSVSYARDVLGKDHIRAALNGLADNAAKALANALDGPVLRGSPR